jgi:hypothetical protein
MAKRTTKKKSAKSKATKPSISPQRITELAWGFAYTLMLDAAVKNRFFD